MALGKLWNALFGRREAPENQLPAVDPASADGTASAKTLGQSRAVVDGEQTAAKARAQASSAQGRGVDVPKHSVLAQNEKPAAKIKRKAAGKRDKKQAPPEEPTIVPVTVPPRVRIAQPQKNAWTKLINGRPIGSILDTNLGDASRAVEILQAIVCDAVPTPKYIAIDPFELGPERLSVLEFHQRVRRAGGQAVAIPGQLTAGLRQLSQTLGTVDLVVLSGSEADLTQFEFRRLLARVTHRDTLVLQQDQRGRWQALMGGATTTSAQPTVQHAARAA